MPCSSSVSILYKDTLMDCEGIVLNCLSTLQIVFLLYLTLRNYILVI